MTFTDLLPAVLQPMAKAVATFLTALIVVGLNWAYDATGIDVPYDAEAIQPVVSALLVALAAYATRNLSRSGAYDDRGFVDSGVLWTIVAFLAIVALIIWIVARV